MYESRRYRVVRCTDCNAVYPHRRASCSACGATERVGSLASAEEVDRVRLLHGVGRKAVIVPKGAAVHAHAAPRTFWRGVLPQTLQRAPELLGVFRRR